MPAWRDIDLMGDFASVKLTEKRCEIHGAGLATIITARKPPSFCSLQHQARRVSLAERHEGAAKFTTGSISCCRTGM